MPEDTVATLAQSCETGQPSPTIQGFIFTWKGHEHRAMALERTLRAVVPLTVINSESAARQRHEHWIHLDESAYFGEQWNRAMSVFDADVLFHIQADADSDQLVDIVKNARSLFQRHPIGVYELNVSYTDICYDRAKLTSIEPNVMQVPWTDCTCWFIHRSVVRLCPLFDLSVNVYGWGICRAIAAIAALEGRLCVRDYSFCVRHPKRRCYPSISAMQQLNAYVCRLGPELRAEIVRLEKIRAATSAPAG